MDRKFAASGNEKKVPRLVSSEGRSGKALAAHSVRAWPGVAGDHADIGVGSELEVAMIR